MPRNRTTTTTIKTLRGTTRGEKRKGPRGRVKISILKLYKSVREVANIGALLLYYFHYIMVADSFWIVLSAGAENTKSVNYSIETKNR